MSARPTQSGLRAQFFLFSCSGHDNQQHSAPGSQLHFRVLKYSVSITFTMVNAGRVALILAVFFGAGFVEIPARPQEPPANSSQSAQSEQTASAPQAAGQITAVPNRPTFATTAESVQRGVLEIEYGFEGGDGHQNINGLVKFGMFTNLELRFANNPFERDASVAGTGDSGAGFKWRFLRQKELRPTLALLYTATIPTANHGLGAKAYGHSVQLLVSKDFGQHHFDLNEGVQYVGRAGPRTGGYDRNYFTSLSWAHPMHGKWGFTAEVAGFSRTSATIPATMTLLFAPTYNVSSRFVLDAGMYVAAYGNLPRATLFCGVTYSIANLYRQARRRQN
jgi:hypothetical protein